MRLMLMSAIVIGMLVGGCEFPGRRGGDQNSGGSTAQRMRAAYTDLAAGRFAVLADFESPAEAGLFRLVSAGTTAPDDRQPSISTLRARDETGAGGLKAVLSSADDAVWFDGQRSESLALLRDWSDYALLMVSIYGPPDGALLDFAIHSGESMPLTWKTRLRIEPGWNLVRVDLAEPGPQIDLSHVRDLVWSAPEIAAPIELYFDDMVLTDNERTILPASGASDELYAQSRGRRVYVGAPGRFELAFADGVIVAWHPSRESRSINLTVRSGLGPWPIALDAAWATTPAGLAYDDAKMFSDWGEHVAAGQAIVESSATRVVMVGQWRFVRTKSKAATQPAASASHTWQYTIYPSGKLYVRLTTDSAEHGWPQPLFGVATAVNGRQGFEPVETPPADANDLRKRFVLLSRVGQNEADLLWVPYDPELARKRRILESSGGDRIAVVTGAVAARDRVESAHMFRLWPTDLDGAAEGESLTEDYRHPARIVPSVGHVVTDSNGDMDGDGFNESEGCYELSASGGILRFSFDPGRRLRYQPVFRVHETHNDRCWVYVDGRILKKMGVDGQGRLIFELPRIVQRPLSIEIHIRPS